MIEFDIPLSLCFVAKNQVAHLYLVLREAEEHCHYPCTLVPGGMKVFGGYDKQSTMSEKWYEIYMQDEVLYI